MELMRPAQYYWTTLYDRYQPQSLSFALIPSRSFGGSAIPQLDTVAATFEGYYLGTGKIQPWHLPVLLASLLAADGQIQTISGIPAQLTDGKPVYVQPQNLGFAEYAAYSDFIPVEESPLKGKSLMAIAAAAGVNIGLIAVAGHPLVILTVPLGILLCTTAAELGPELGKKLPRLMGLK